MTVIKTSNALISLSLLAFLISCCWYSIYLASPPSVVSGEAAPNLFSAERSKSHLTAIAEKPHSMGTEEHRQVREYLYKQLDSLGLNPVVDTSTVISRKNTNIIAGRVHNVSGRLKGTANHKTILLAAHYDTQPNTPGAADDGSGVAVLLEVARAIKALGTPPENDILFLFTDGEESGLFGAQAFVENKRLPDSIGLVINLEARGNSGSSLAFEFSDGNGWLVKELAAAVPGPLAASIMYEVYKLMPNSTDFTKFKKAGLQGYNFAMVEGFAHYHSLTDTPERISLNSVQHQGNNVLALVRHFASASFEQKSSDDYVFFNPAGKLLVYFSGSVNLFLIVLTAALYLLYVFLALRYKHIKWRVILLGAISFPALIGLLVTITILLSSLIPDLYPHYRMFYAFNYYNHLYYFLFFMSLNALLFFLVTRWPGRKFSTAGMMAGLLITPVILMFYLYSTLETAAYFLMYPVLISVVTLLAEFFIVRRQKQELTEQKRILVWLLPAVLHILFFFPVVYLLHIIFSIRMEMAAVTVFTFLLVFLYPIISVLTRNHLKYHLMILGVMAVAALTTAHIRSGYSAEHPLKSDLSFFYDQDSKTAKWISAHPEAQIWNREFFKDFQPDDTLYYVKSGARYYSKPVPGVSSIQGSEVKLLKDSLSGNVRYISLKITPGNNASMADLILKAKNNALQAVKINGQVVPSAWISNADNKGNHTIKYYGFDKTGIHLYLEIPASEKTSLQLLSKAVGLPSGTPSEPAIPESVIPAPDFESNITFVSRRVDF